MAQRQCETCGEMVDEAKAFCPACGNAFVKEEKREQQSKFESLDSTMQMGQTMYGNMLSEMGLNISSKPAAPPPEKRVEVIAPAAPAAVKPAAPRQEQPRQETLKPVEQATKPPGRKSYLVWIIAAAAILIIGFLLLVALGVFLYWYGVRLR